MSPQIAGPRRCKVTLITFVSPHGLIGCDSKGLFELYKGKPQQKKPFFSPKCGWVGWLIPKQGPNTSKPTQITKTLGWVNKFGRDLPKKVFFVCWVLDAGHGYFYTEYL